MTDKSITQLDEATELDGTDLIEVVTDLGETPVNKKASIDTVTSEISDALAGTYVAHDGTPEVGDWLRVKSVDPLVVERVDEPTGETDERTETLLATYTVDEPTAEFTHPVPEADGYSAIVVRVRAKGDQTFVADLRCRFNGDDSAIYDYSTDASVNSGATFLSWSSAVVGVDEDSGRYGALDLTFANPNEQDGRHRHGSTVGLHRGDTLAGQWAWRSTDPIRLATWFPHSGTFVAGTRFDVYGVREPSPVAVHELAVDQESWEIPIPEGFDDVELRIWIQVTDVSSTSLRLRVNGDTASNYEYIGSPGSASSASDVRVGDVPGTSTPALFAHGVIRVVDVENTTRFRAGSWFFGYGNTRWRGVWRHQATEPLETITLFPFAGSFIAGSRVEVHGVRRRNHVATYVVGDGGQASPLNIPIPQGYDEVVLEGRLRSDVAASGEALQFRFNNDDNNVYDARSHLNTFTTAATQVTFDSGSISGTDGRWSNTQVAIQTGNVDAGLHHRFGTFQSHGRPNAGAVVGAYRYRVGDPIESLQFLLPAGDFVEGSEVKVYAYSRADRLPIVTHDGTLEMGDSVRVKSLDPLVLETDPGAYVAVVDAGSNLSTARPAGAVAVLWRFAAETDVGEEGANVVNGEVGDLYFVASS